ncbi:MAG TPA: hypothetical protein VNF24_00815 [Candidatus Acidoferrales bacterium]|nr:hypothetical protein [Candidatus Acidoferrales bacterium]
MTKAVLDDHLLRDVLGNEIAPGLRKILRTHEPATTNLYLLRLCRSVVAAPGGQLTGQWPRERREALAQSLLELPQEIEVLPMRGLAFAMAQLASSRRVSKLGAEAVAAAQTLGGPLCVWTGDDGPAIRECAKAHLVNYRVIER